MKKVLGQIWPAGCSLPASSVENFRFCCGCLLVLAGSQFSNVQFKICFTFCGQWFKSWFCSQRFCNAAWSLCGFIHRVKGQLLSARILLYSLAPRTFCFLFPLARKTEFLLKFYSTTLPPLPPCLGTWGKTAREKNQKTKNKEETHPVVLLQFWFHSTIHPFFLKLQSLQRLGFCIFSGVFSGNKWEGWAVVGLN